MSSFLSSTTITPIPHSLGLRAAEWVQVRSKEEILSTLDANGRLDQMPFMPEMFKFCGQKFMVGKRAHKTCDPVNGLDGRRLPDSVHLENLRCDGADHDGCQAGCLIYWKEAWVKRLEPHDVVDAIPATPAQGAGGCTEMDVFAGVRAAGVQPGDEKGTYVCQATQVRAATVSIKWWNLRQYVEDYTSGNASLFRVLSAFTFTLYHGVTHLGLGFDSAMRFVYDTFQKLFGGTPYPWRLGTVKKGTRTPASARLDVQEGELVKIKDYRAILDTLDENWRNRGLYFDAEMVPYTNKTFRVLKRVQRIIDEKTGKMIRLKNDALILDNVVCQARYAKCRKLCPRAYYLYWREIWVDRVVGAPATGQRQNEQQAGCGLP